MKKFVILLSVFVFVGVFGYGSGMAANPSKIKVGILLPLTDFFPKLKELMDRRRVGHVAHRRPGRFDRFAHLRSTRGDGAVCDHAADSSDQTDRSLWQQAVETVTAIDIGSP